MPCGEIDAGENPEETARRELLEETGRHCRKIVPVGTGRTLLNRVNARQYLFLAEGVEPEPSAEIEPGVTSRLVTWQEFREMTLRGEFEHLAALGLLLKLQWQRPLFPSWKDGS